MGTQTQGASPGGVYKWEVPGKPVAIHLELDVVDRMLRDVMQGFGAVPKRGAEVGGILLGSATTGDRLVVQIEDYELVPCEYRRGPSYLLSETDMQAFDDVCSRWRRTEDSTLYAVGYFRSHTREGLGLGPDDLDLCARYFADPSSVALLIRPYATRVSTAGFLFYENGKFQDSPYLEFPFRRRELEGRPAGGPRPQGTPRRAVAVRLRQQPVRPPLSQEDSPPEEEYAPEPDGAWEEPEVDAFAPVLAPEPAPARQGGVPSGYDIPKPAKSIFRGRWAWIPLSFIFLVLGVVLGFQTAFTISSRNAAVAQRGPDLALTVRQTSGDLNLTWDRNSPAVRNARRGVLSIQDGGFQQSVDLDGAQLQTGSIIFHNSTNQVRFSLEVYLRDDLTVAQTLEWRGR